MWGVEGWLQCQSDPVLQMPPRTRKEAPISCCFECVCLTFWTDKSFFRQCSPIRNAVKADDVQRCFTWHGWAMHCEGTLHLRAAGEVGGDKLSLLLKDKCCNSLRSYSAQSPLTVPADSGDPDISWSISGYKLHIAISSHPPFLISSVTMMNKNSSSRHTFIIHCPHPTVQKACNYHI